MHTGQRRHLVALFAGVIGLATVCSAAVAQSDYPNRPIRLVVGFGAGGATDIVGRVLGNKLSVAFKQSVVIENRTGGSGTVATEAVGRAEPDGYTLLVTPLANAVNEILVKGLKTRVGEQLVGVVPMAESGNVLIVHPSMPVRSVSELIAYARSQPPDSIVAAASGRGTATHLAIELFNSMAGVKIRPVHYKGGGDTIRDLVTGEVKLMFATIAPILEYVRNGALRGIATTGPKRDSALPDLPTMIEAGLTDYDVRLWIGLTAPAGTPRPIIERLAAETNRALEAADLKAAFAAQGFEPMPGSPEQFDRLYRSEVVRWRKVIETTGMTGD
jgi:tripartite-type tricarboxylate transporter receptor subunit TctC